MNPLPSAIAVARYLTIKEDKIKPIWVAGRKIFFFELQIDYCFEDGALSELDRIWVRASDVVVDCPPSDIERFLHRSHLWQGVPESVWLQGRAIKPIPFMEAVNFWHHQMQSSGHQWAAIVFRELERLETLVYQVFQGIEIAEEEQWTLTDRDFDGRPTAFANESQTLASPISRPTQI